MVERQSWPWHRSPATNVSLEHQHRLLPAALEQGQRNSQGILPSEQEHVTGLEAT